MSMVDDIGVDDFGSNIDGSCKIQVASRKMQWRCASEDEKNRNADADCGRKQQPRQAGWMGTGREPGDERDMARHAAWCRPAAWLAPARFQSGSNPVHEVIDSAPHKLRTSCARFATLSVNCSAIGFRAPCSAHSSKLGSFFARCEWSTRPQAAPVQLPRPLRN